MVLYKSLSMSSSQSTTTHSTTTCLEIQQVHEHYNITIATSDLLENF